MLRLAEKSGSGIPLPHRYRYLTATYSENMIPKKPKDLKLFLHIVGYLKLGGDVNAPFVREYIKKYGVTVYELEKYAKIYSWTK